MKNTIFGIEPSDNSWLPRDRRVSLLMLLLLFVGQHSLAGGHLSPGPDSDSDGFSNYIESRLGSDPNDDASVPETIDDIWVGFETEVPPTWFVPADADAGWYRSDLAAAKGLWSLQSEAIEADQTASVVWPVLVNDSKVIFNYWEFSSDRLVVYLDDVEVRNFSGNASGWQYNRISIQLSAGYHEIRFEYQKNAFGTSFCDCARIDNARVLDRVSDNDGMRDAWELEFGLDPNDPSDAVLDLDEDGLTNLEEYENQTIPTNPDSDNDGLSDGDEVNTYSTDPNDADSDDDDLSDGDEVASGTDPNVPSRESDTDEDGVTDYAELRLLTDPLDPDSTPVAVNAYFAGFEAGLPPNWYSLSPDSDPGWFRSDADAFDGTWSLESDIDSSTDSSIVIPILTRESTLNFAYFNTLSSLSVYVDGLRVFFGFQDDEWLRPVTPIPLSAGFHEIRFEHSNSSFPGRGVRLDNIYIAAVDIDQDGIPNEWEWANGLDPYRRADGQQDPDGDGLVNLVEWENDTDPFDSDSDGDSIEDNIELTVYGLDPALSDTDGDSLPDGYEIDTGLDPLVSNRGQDTDGDGVDDTYEYLVGTDPQISNPEPPYVDEYFESFEQPDATDFWLTPDGDHVSWFRSSAASWLGSFSLESEQTGDRNNEAIITLPVRVYASEMTFQHFVNGDAGDQLFVYVDGEEVFRGGRPSWRLSPLIPLTDGYHEISFVFRESGTEGGCNCARIDNLQIVRVDFDKDGLPDVWENEQGLDFEDPSDAVLDSDGDGLNNLAEFANMTLALNPDSDADGALDGIEVNTYGTDPNDLDTDDDELPDGWEIDNGTNPTLALDRDADSDGDGVPNIGEFYLGTDAADINSVTPFTNTYIEGFEGPLPDFWTTSIYSQATWQRSNEGALEGEWSLKSELIEVGETAEIIVPVRVRDSWFRIRTYRNAPFADNIFIYVDGEEVYNSIGLRWTWGFTPKIPLSEGYHEIRITYQKQTTQTSLCNCGRVDFLEIRPADP